MTYQRRCFRSIYKRAVSQEVFMNLICKMCPDIKNSLSSAKALNVFITVCPMDKWGLCQQTRAFTAITIPYRQNCNKVIPDHWFHIIVKWTQQQFLIIYKKHVRRIWRWRPTYLVFNTISVIKMHFQMLKHVIYLLIKLYFSMML